MMYYELKQGTKLTEEQEEMLANAAKRPVQPDKDCPELTKEDIAQFYRVSERHREDRRNQTVTLRLSAQALNTAKSPGKGYTDVLSRILEDALKDKDVIQHYL